MKTIDTSGLSCPQPVLLVLQCLKAEAPQSLGVIVDNEASLENVTRAAQNNGYDVQEIKDGDKVVLNLSKK